MAQSTESAVSDRLQCSTLRCMVVGECSRFRLTGDINDSASATVQCCPLVVIDTGRHLWSVGVSTRVNEVVVWMRSYIRSTSGFQSTRIHILVSIGVVFRVQRSNSSCHRGVSSTGDDTCSVRGSFLESTSCQRPRTRPVNE